MEDVPGITRILGDRWRRQASATCMGAAPRRAATSDNVTTRGGKTRARRNQNYFADVQLALAIFNKLVQRAGLIAYLVDCLSGRIRTVLSAQHRDRHEQPILFTANASPPGIRSFRFPRTCWADREMWLDRSLTTPKLGELVGANGSRRPGSAPPAGRTL